MRLLCGFCVLCVAGGMSYAPRWVCSEIRPYPTSCGRSRCKRNDSGSVGPVNSVRVGVCVCIYLVGMLVMRRTTLTIPRLTLYHSIPFHLYYLYHLYRSFLFPSTPTTPFIPSAPSLPSVPSLSGMLVHATQQLLATRIKTVGESLPDLLGEAALMLVRLESWELYTYSRAPQRVNIHTVVRG